MVRASVVADYVVPVTSFSSDQFIDVNALYDTMFRVL